MDSLSHFHSKSVNFNIHHSNSPKVTALDIYFHNHNFKVDSANQRRAERKAQVRPLSIGPMYSYATDVDVDRVHTQAVVL